METTIWLVIEQGAGLVHKAFEDKADAIVFAEKLKKDEDMDCFDVVGIWYLPKE